MTRHQLCGSFFVLALACGGGEGDDASVDAGVGEADAQRGIANTCTGDCATMDLTASFGATTRTFDRAFFGLTSPQNSDSGEWEIYIENGAGDDDACPTLKSPVPDYLFVLANLPEAENAGPVQATANLLDFEGALLPAGPREEASSNSVTWSAYDPCIPCAEGSEPDRANRMVAVDIEASFAAGTISGHSYATHCDSLDDL